MSSFATYQNVMLPEFNQALKKFIDDLFPDKTSELNRIFYYHLGLSDDLKSQGKRIRPMLTLLCAEGAGGDWKLALPAAIAIELVHNFSLIHDDIEDNGEKRRGKDAVWIKWGLAKGLNAGDVMFSTAFKALKRLDDQIPAGINLNATHLLADTCVNLTVGQQHDIGFQDQEQVEIDQYFRMIEGKTAALIAAACQMGAVIAGREQRIQSSYCEFGHSLGIAFQIYDDWLGVWGNEERTGKTTSGDLVEGKKSLPVIMGLEHSIRFRQRWNKGPVTIEDSTELTTFLREDGVEKLVKSSFVEWTERAMAHLRAMDCSAEVKEALREFANKLIIRNR